MDHLVEELGTFAARLRTEGGVQHRNGDANRAAIPNLPGAHQVGSPTFSPRVTVGMLVLMISSPQFKPQRNSPTIKMKKNTA